jgi:hypothetical protein
MGVDVMSNFYAILEWEENEIIALFLFAYSNSIFRGLCND